MNIILENKTIDGKYQGLIFLLMDINDLLGKPFTLVIGSGNVFIDFDFNIYGWSEDSTKGQFAKWFKEAMANYEANKARLRK